MNFQVRPFQLEDIPYLLDYWYNNSEDNLTRMGVDKSLLGPRIKREQDLIDSFHTPNNLKDNFHIIWLINNEPVGHNSFDHILINEISHMHLHMWSQKWRGKGYGAILFCQAVMMFYSLFHPKIILSEPCSENAMPNKMFEKIGFKKWKSYLAKSSEISILSELTNFIIDQEIALKYLKANGILEARESLFDQKQMSPQDPAFPTEQA